MKKTNVPDVPFVPPTTWSLDAQMKIEARKREHQRYARIAPVVEILLDSKTLLWVAVRDCEKHVCECCGLPKVWYKEPGFVLHSTCPRTLFYRLVRIHHALGQTLDQLGAVPNSPTELIARIRATQTPMNGGGGK